MAEAKQIPRQTPISWRVVFGVSWAGLRRRMSRSLVTVSCVVLAIAFISYMLIIGNIAEALIALNDSALNIELQKNGIDVFAATQTDQMTVLLLGLALLTCTVGIVNSMLMSVTERIKEIGTLKCLGARDMFIIKTYFVESTLQGICGALAGLVLGCLIAVTISLHAYGMSVLQTFPALPVCKSLIVSFSCGSLISVLSAIAPAYMAAKKQPVDALRVEE